jgi:hypothetical protein
MSLSPSPSVSFSSQENRSSEAANEKRQTKANADPKHLSKKNPSTQSPPE